MKRNKIPASLAAILFFIPLAAAAQDTLYNWSGFSAGVSLGYGQGDGERLPLAPPLPVFDIPDRDSSGAVPGIQISYDC